MKHFTFSALLVAAAVCGAAPAYACNVPVFRYALERWHPDPYRVTVFHRGPLSDADLKLLQPLEESDGSANVRLQVVDVAGEQKDADRALFAAQATPQLPWLVVQYPQSLRNDATIWAGPLAEGATARAVASPLRTELVRRLAAGQTAVWLLLECGDAAKDDDATQRLVDELKKLETKLKLPELTASPDDSLLSGIPLKVTFSVLRVPRNVATEQSFIEMLLHAESDLKDLKDPMIFPVFGRGRALLPLIGAGITPENIEDSGSFLVGACSCEVKELNPGFDLLLAADWNGLLFENGPPPEVAAARPVAATGEPELVSIPSGAPPTVLVPVADNEEAMLEFYYESTGLRNFILLGLALAAIVSVCVLKAFRALRR